MNLQGSTISFPFRPDETGTLACVGDKADIIAQAIQDVLETRQGERVMMPDYGIADFVFSVQNSSFAARLAFHIEQQVRRYVPTVRTIRSTAATDEQGRATVEITYTEVGAVNAPRNLVFPVWRYQQGGAE